MDLMDLRAFIEGQKHRLRQDRAALRYDHSAKPPPENFLHSSSPTTSSQNTSVNEEIESSQVSALLSERINNLNNFKSQVRTNGEGNENFDYQLECSTQPGSQSVLDENIQKGEKEACEEQPSRDREVEKLQEKFASVPFWDNFGRSATAKRWSSDAPGAMVRVGEFSPANPDLQAPGKALLGLGEYEERRRQLLEKKKQEYKEYLSHSRNVLQRTDHLVHHAPQKSDLENSNAVNGLMHKVTDHVPPSISVDAATQTESWLTEQASRDTQPAQVTLSVRDSTSPIPQLSPRVSRAHSSQTAEQLPDARVRQLQLQEELRQQIEEKRRLEAERREQERLEEEALQRRVAEQQARLQAEYERDEKLRREREIQKQQQIEEFQRRQEELRAESEAIKLEERRQKLEAAEAFNQKQMEHAQLDPSKVARNAHLAPPSEPAPLSILKSTSPPLRSPRRTARGSQYSDEYLNPEPLSPRALIKVLEGPTLPKQQAYLEDSLPIPLMPATRRSPKVSPQRSPNRSPQRSPRRSPHRSPHHSPSRFVAAPALASRRLPKAQPKPRGPSEAMQNLEERWKVPAVQKNVCTRGKQSAQDSNTGNVLTQLGAFRRQLQMEHMRMEEKVREKHQPNQYHQQVYQQHSSQRSNYI
ncbi:stress response protein NST1-like isoform X2 [Thrips palmi]|uniref:Stress response protein NST1-like isoform X2 n=1 Tax=Thrips palmi TaxID=161013 RepID=A0A6P8ZB49_THRPL|nr:stress response protein NST1-like isoform X2 [Thrips palmi]